jgi:cupin superfamily protein
MTVDPEEFVREVFGHRHLHTPAADPRGFGDLFSLEALNDLLARGVRTSSLRLVRDGTEAPVTDGCVPEAGDAPATAPFPGTDALRAAMAGGHTLIVRSLHRLHPPLERFAHEAARELGHPVRVNAFITPPRATGVDLHFDVQDVLVLQVAGNKRWRLRTPAVRDPLPVHAWFDATTGLRERWRQSGRDLPEVDLRAGDTLYLPRGTFHAPSTGENWSIHLTVAISTVTRHDLLTALVGAAAQDPRLRTAASLDDLAADPAAARAEIARLCGILADVAASADAADLVWAARRTAFAGFPAEPVPVVPGQGMPLAYRLRRGAQFRVVTGESPGEHPDGDSPGGDGRLVLQVGGRRVALPAAVAPLLEELRRGRLVPAARLSHVCGEETAARVGGALVTVGMAMPISERFSSEDFEGSEGFDELQGEER